MVVDADALHAGPALIRGAVTPRVATPHLGEFRAAFPEHAEVAETDRFAAARDAAATLAAPDRESAVLLKGVPTVVAGTRGQLNVVGSGNPGLATGGSGDVLSGFVAALLAQRVPPHAAAALGAHLLGRAAELASAQASIRTMRPDDVLAAAPRAWRVMAEAARHIPPVRLRLEPPVVQ